MDCVVLCDDVLADVLRRLPLHGLATARRVCHAWRALIDDRALTQHAAALLPRSVRGLFVVLNMPDLQGFFARPSPPATATAGTGIAGVDLDYPPPCRQPGHAGHDSRRRRGEQRTSLDDIAAGGGGGGEIVLLHDYRGLAFDPAESPHYEVFSMPHILRLRRPLPAAMSVSEQWPPSPLVLPVFSSTTMRWEEQPFTREGDATMGTIADSRLQIWYLNENESSGCSSMTPMLASYPSNNGGRQWIWHNAETKQDKSRELPVNEEEFEWAIDDDDDDNSGGASGEDNHYDGYIDMILGFHPFKDIVFLYDTDIRVVAYHYNKAKVQDLGMLFIERSTERVLASYPYTPYWICDLPGMQC
uniref:F-box domain-containing protein n=1 Tax=Oryza punctata TaxID=4537 RepID=A0A0E0MPV4_ORYPU